MALQNFLLGFFQQGSFDSRQLFVWGNWMKLKYSTLMAFEIWFCEAAKSYCSYRFFSIQSTGGSLDQFVILSFMNNFCDRLTESFAVLRRLLLALALFAILFLVLKTQFHRHWALAFDRHSIELLRWKIAGVSTRCHCGYRLRKPLFHQSTVRYHMKFLKCRSYHWYWY